MDANTTIRTTKTKYNATDKSAITTKITFDWNGCTEEDFRELAEPSAVIRAQSYWRKSVIPAETTINVHELVNRERAPKAPPSVATIARDAETFTPEQLAEAIAALQAKLQK